jgi:hypothetical protein
LKEGEGGAVAYVKKTMSIGAHFAKEIGSLGPRRHKTVANDLLVKLTHFLQIFADIGVVV